MRTAILKTLAFILLYCISQQAIASLLNEEVSFQRVFQGAPWLEIPNQATFIVGTGAEFTAPLNSYTIDVGENTIRTEIIAPGGGGFSDSPPHEMRFFLPMEILGASVKSSNFAGLNAANVSHTRNKLVVDINNLNPLPQGAYFEITLNLATSAKAVPIWSPWSVVVMVLGMGLIYAWHARKQSA
jgi:hypothetical protein